MIRKFRCSDLKDILEIEKRAFPKSPYNRFTFWYYASAYADNFLVYVHEDKEKGLNKIVGYITFYPSGHIVSIAVHPANRRRGIGTELVREVLKRTKGNASVEVRESNEVAKEFYKHLGFSLRTIIPKYYGDEDALVMIRKGSESSFIL
ncbi:ribosomal-protein-alanine N-acetyltransferase [Methanosarcinales archaeon]|nr:MAG: ribosomal-protein-alanine N-acetyltransferase [Methanosarcinales archaeon]